MNGIEREVKRQGKEALWNKLLQVADRTPFGLAAAPVPPRPTSSSGGKLDFIVSGGAALDPDLGRKWELLGVKIVQVTGPPGLRRSSAITASGKGGWTRTAARCPT